VDSNIAALTTIFTEFYYWITIPLMFLIHVGFCMYEVGVSRYKNHQHTLMKNTMLIPLVTVTFFFVGWWIYWAFPNGPWIYHGQGLIFNSGEALAGWGGNDLALPWDPIMAVNFNDHLMMVFWGAFLLFSWTAASIVSGAVIERIRISAFGILAIAIGSIFWVIDASWGWHFNGWMVKVLGYHDAYASGVIHAVAGGFALGILVVLGPRIGKFASDGTPINIGPRNPWMVTLGLFLIYTGFWGFYAACNIPIFDIGADYGVAEAGTLWSATTIYVTPTTLSGITVNFLMSLAGGLLMGYVVSKGDPFWTYSSGLAGIITASAGNDLYHPLQAMIIAAIGVAIMYKLHYWVERRFKIDDAVGAVAVHGYAGVVGLVICGFVLWGYPSSPYEADIWNPDFLYAAINPLGMIAGAIIMFGVLGFLPGWIIASILNAAGKLRIPREVELAGMDLPIMQASKSEHDAHAAAEH
jgi:ammonia channel protein AmtB|tara:strand:+ start:375 stop:1778 length:1404 start_codon:yes stop_codon:yes gene_type:complete